MERNSLLKLRRDRSLVVIEIFVAIELRRARSFIVPEPFPRPRVTSG